MFYLNLSLLARTAIVSTCSFLLFCSCKKNNTEEALPVLGTCQSVAPTAELKLIDAQTYQYESAGGAVIQIKRFSRENMQIILTYKAYPNFKYEFWGGAEPGMLSPASHENLNGKHIKDKLGVNRTVIFPDGTKMTYVATAAWYMGGITAISIYDGAMVHHLNIECFKLEYSSVNENIAKRLDDMQADGETSTFDITETGLLFYNIYNEEKPGNKQEERVELGRLNKNIPHQVNDLYDDPRIGHT
jgi:hypothetical protein